MTPQPQHHDTLDTANRPVGPDLVPLWDEIDAEDDLSIPSLRTAGHRVWSSFHCADSDALDPESSGVLRSPALEPVAVYRARVAQGRQVTVTAVRAKVLPRGRVELTEEHELVEMDFITLEQPPTPRRELPPIVQERHAPVLSTSREKGRRNATARAPQSNDRGLVVAGFALVGAMVSVFLVLFSGYGA